MVLTIDDPLDPPDAQRDDEADGVPGAAGAVGHCGGHHWGQRQDNDGPIKHLGTGETAGHQGQDSTLNTHKPRMPLWSAVITPGRDI